MKYGYHMAMKKAMISELKNRLSHYLQLVRRGQPVLVYDRDRLIARIEPVRHRAREAEDDVVAQLEAAGILRPPTTRLPTDWLRRRPAMTPDVTAALLEERESAR